MKRVLLVAGEPSADSYGAEVVRNLKKLIPEISIEGIGGDRLTAEGMHILQHMDSLSVMGLAETITSAPAHFHALRRIRRNLAGSRYDLVLLIDYPGFNLKVAKAAAASQIPVLYYVAPQLWAWNEQRSKNLKRDVTILAVVLPFEQPYFERLGVTAKFVGHPLLDVPAPPAQASARHALGIAEQGPVLALFPGSRRFEIERLWGPFKDAALRLRHRIPDLAVVVATLGNFRLPVDDFVRLRDDPSLVLAAADAAICKSGTSVLQCALTDTPMVVAYKFHPLSYFFARRLVRIDRIALVNLILEDSIVPELIQDAVDGAALANATLPLLDPDHEAAAKQRRAFTELKQLLGRPGAGLRVAELAAHLLG